MHIEFLPSSEGGLRWFRRYYEHVFPDGRKNGLARYRQAIKTLQSDPYLGHNVEGYKDVREIPIVRTPFSFVYLIDNEVISIIDVRDARGLRTSKVLDKSFK